MPTYREMTTGAAPSWLRRGRRWRNWKTWLIGRPLPTADAGHHTIGKTVGLAVFSSDALSSTAYATQEILLILALAGAAALPLAVPISFAIVILLAIVAVSYYQTIHAYPGGGGSYIVSRDNLGEAAAQVAGAALLVDYVLTVAVSISSGVAQIVSAFPTLLRWRVEIAVVCVIVVALINLRGVRESGAVFAVPTYFFIALMATFVVTGLVRYASGTLAGIGDPPHFEPHGELQAIGLFLILHAFSSGTTALTGVEAISNGVTAFREPRSANAAWTLVLMALILSTLFLGITFLAVQVGAVPSEVETVISQLARTVFEGRGLLYLGVIAGTTLVLILAANTAFNGFPRLGAIQAADGFLPRQLTYRGSRLVYSRGIVVLALLASLLIIAFQASVSALIPLYAIGVFLCFTLSQAGMTLRWSKVGRLSPGVEVRERGSVLRFDRLWRLKAVFNAAGAICTAAVVAVFAVTKFWEGAWIVVLVIPLLVVFHFAIHRHYRELDRELSLDDYGPPPRVRRHRVLVPVSDVHRGTVEALRYARSLSDDVTAVHVASDAEREAAFQRKWDRWGEGLRLIVLESPYRLFVEPFLEYVERVLASRQPDENVTIVVPQFVPYRRWHNLLHAQAAAFLRMALLFRRGVVITSVPYQLRGRAAGIEED